MAGEEPYGMELILDLHGCDREEFCRSSILAFFELLCEKIDMEPEDVHFWDDVGVPEAEQQTNPKTKGTSAVQFILTSTIVVHTLDKLRKVFINIFSCKPFDPTVAKLFCRDYFKAKTVASAHLIERK